MFRKRYYYRGAVYAKNYKGENEARVKNADGTFTTKDGIKNAPRK